MTGPDESPTPPPELPDPIVDAVSGLGLSELKSLRQYVERSIESLRPPIEDAIRSEAAGEILEIDSHGSYAHVRMRLPTADSSDGYEDASALYHVRREEYPDGSESLHWTYLENLGGDGRDHCEQCGWPVDDDADACSHCGHRLDSVRGGT